MSEPSNAIVIGGGPVGSMAALYLAKRHADLFPGGVEVYERRADSRGKETAEAGRSINLAISSRSFYAWDDIDPSIKTEIVEKVGIKMYGRNIHHKNGKCEFQAYGRIEKDEFILSVDRRVLGEVLISKAEAQSNVKVHFETRIVSIDIEKGVVTLCKTVHNEDGSTTEETFTKTAKLIIGADGANSVVRAEIQRNPKARCDLEQHCISHSYKELTISPIGSGADKKFAMKADALHIWPRHDYMLIALPNPEKDFTATLFCAHDGENSFTKDLDTEEKVVEFFKREFPDAYELMKDNLLTDWRKNPKSDLTHIQCTPHNFRDKVVIVGDAAHAIIPFFGQGCNAGIEDTRILSEVLTKFKEDKSLKPNEILEKALPYYSAFRKPNTDAILELSKQNFIEMRSKTATKMYAFQKKLGLFLHSLMPETFKPLYSMVTFSPQIPYSVAWKTCVKREKRLKKVSKLLTLVATVGAGYAAYKYLLPILEKNETVKSILNKFKK